MINQDLCCEELSVVTQNDAIISYEKVDRTFVIEHVEGKCRSIEFCPFCGTKLPEPLNSKIYEVIEKEYGIPFEEIDICNFTNVPDEFKTDEWWKKRGL